MSVSSINDLLLQALNVQPTATSRTSGSSGSSASDLLGGADFAKLLELQMSQSTLNLAGLGDDASGDTTSGSTDNMLSSLMSSGTGSDSSSQLESLMVLRLLETVVDRLSALQQPAASQAVPSGEPAAAAASSADVQS